VVVVQGIFSSLLEEAVRSFIVFTGRCMISIRLLNKTNN
jgi:hypothetical protein